MSNGKLGVKFKVAYDITEGVGFETIWCWCGAVHQASGTNAELREKRTAWVAAHANCSPPQKERTS